MPSVLVVRGHLANPWELRPWLELPSRYEVSYLRTGANRFTPPPGLRARPVRALRDLLPAGVAGEVVTGLIGDRYLQADGAFAEADIVHSAELSFWFAADAARRRLGRRFALVQTVWETLPMRSAYRNWHARRNRERVLAATDLFLPTTERAALALQLEGVAPERMMVVAPGIDIERFAGAGDERPAGAGAEHVIVSPGRLVWEKGHQDVLRALALLHQGIVRPGDGTIARPRLLVIGAGPEDERLRRHAAELGLADAIEIRSVPYDDMPRVFAGASAMVLASQPSAYAGLHPFDVPRAFWEEQFGMVLAEAIASGLSIITTTSGAIPEVVDGAGVDLVAPGDWPAIARALARGPLARPAGTRVAYPSELVERYSTRAAAARLTEAYDRVLALPRHG